jgi:DNA polymerase-1
MLHHKQYEAGDKDILVLIKARDMDLNQIRANYLSNLQANGLDISRVIVMNLAYEASGKAPVVRCARPHLELVGKAVEKLGIKTVLCCDAHYFKTLAGVRKADPELGYPKNCSWEGVTAFYLPNYSAALYDTRINRKIEIGVRAVDDWLHQRQNQFEEDILVNPEYYLATSEIARSRLKDLLEIPELTCDIETDGLMVGSALLSISFAWNQSEGLAIMLRGDDSEGMRERLRQFFLEYQGKLIWHGGTFDVKQLIWQLFMDGPSDFDGMLKGLEVFFDQIQYEDSMTLTYLATNSTGGNDLSLKAQAFEYTGKYAIDDMENLSNLSDEEILRYNLIDTVGTWFVYNKHRQTVRDEQEKVYQNLFLPSLKTITQMELVGLPLDMDEVLSAERELEAIADSYMEVIDQHPLIDDLNLRLRELEAEKRNKTLKKLRKTADDFPDLFFNPGSTKQIQELLHTILDLPVMNRTATKQPATDADSLKGHIAYLQQQRKDEASAELLSAILGWAEVTKITGTFIKAMKENSLQRDAWYSLYGSFNLGGTKSGRLSSSNPNLQNIPSTGTQYAKAIKRCVHGLPPTIMDPGWLFVGADFLSLEDRINALLTKDPNKLKVYTGHNIFEITVDGVTHRVRDDDIISYDGKQMTGQEFYDTYR